MKAFSIRKTTNPNQNRGVQGSADMNEDQFKYAAKGGEAAATNKVINTGEGPSLLTEEENQALKPKEVKVDNPWIYEQTH